MFGFTGFNELLLLMLIIAVLSLTGIWPRIIQGIRELRGDVPPGSGGNGNVAPHDLELAYKILGLSPSASWQEIEQAYRRKARIHHPDHGGDEDAMRALNDAYAQLKKLKRK